MGTVTLPSSQSYEGDNLCKGPGTWLQFSRVVTITSLKIIIIIVVITILMLNSIYIFIHYPHFHSKFIRSTNHCIV